MTTIQTYKTSFGMYASTDYETYKKLKTIKSCYNVSRLKSKRYDKWGYKAEHNRTDNKPELCPQFHTEIESEAHEDFYYDQNSGRHKYRTRKIAQSQSTNLGGRVIDAWVNSKPKANEEDVVPLECKFDLDTLYNAVLPYYEKHCLMPNRKDK